MSFSALALNAFEESRGPRVLSNLQFDFSNLGLVEQEVWMADDNVFTFPFRRRSDAQMRSNEQHSPGSLPISNFHVRRFLILTH